MQKQEILDQFNHPQLQNSRVGVEKILQVSKSDSSGFDKILKLLNQHKEAKKKAKQKLASEIRDGVAVLLKKIEKNDLQEFKKNFEECDENKKDAFFSEHTKISLERNGDIVIQVSGVRVGIIKSKDAKFTDSEACLFRSHFEEGKRGSKQPLQEEFEGSKVNEFFRDWYCVEVTAASTFNRSRNKREFVVTQWRDEALNVFLTYLHYPDDSSVVDFKKRWDLD